jgi:pSer/pThr/pTyr-binding forkhead associated (FHA) protein
MPAAQATQTSTTAAELVLVSEPSLGVESIALSSGRWTVGSSDENRIVVREPGIADQHCLLLVTGEQILMKSWSGQTRVNGRPQQEAYVRAGDVLTFGDADFQIRRADSTQSDGEESQRTGSIVGQIETLAEIVEEPNREFAGRCTEVDRLDQMIARIQAGLEKSATSEDTITRLRSQIVELQQTATAEAEKENASRHQTDDSENDLRIQAAQQNLDQIIHGLEEEELAFGDPGFERQLSLRVQHKLRQLESVSASLQGRAAVLEQQAIELDGQRSQYGEWRPEAGHDSESSLNGLPESHEEDSSFDASPENDSQFSDHAFGNDEAPGEYGSFAEPVSEDSGFDSPLKKGSDPLDDVEKQGKTGRPERVRLAWY